MSYVLQVDPRRSIYHSLALPQPEKLLFLYKERVLADARCAFPCRTWRGAFLTTRRDEIILAVPGALPCRALFTGDGADGTRT